MSKPFLFLIAALAVIAVSVMALKKTGRPPAEPDRFAAPIPTGVGSDGAAATRRPLSEADRQRIRAFWAIYQQATEEKQARQWEEAARDYRKALELDPQHWDSLYYLGNALMELRRYEEAERAYARLAASDPQAARAYSALGALYSNPNATGLFDLRKAEQEYTRAWRANADESGSVLRLGEVAVAAGEMARAQEYLQAAGRTNFKSVSAHFLQGYLAWKAGQRERARTLFARSIELTKVSKPPAGVLGEGDTRLPGYQAMVLPGQRGLFDGFIAELWKNHDTGDARLNGLYKRVDGFIRSLPSR
jgi:tetratricopeptide (TPR) repeat protein